MNDIALAPLYPISQTWQLCRLGKQFVWEMQRQWLTLETREIVPSQSEEPVKTFRQQTLPVKPAKYVKWSWLTMYYVT